VTVIGFDGSALARWTSGSRWRAVPRRESMKRLVAKLSAITKVFGYLATYYANLQITHRPIRIAAWSSAEHRFCYTPLPPLTAAPQTRSPLPFSFMLGNGVWAGLRLCKPYGPARSDVHRALAHAGCQRGVAER
jgi:hypothetical protein